MKKDDKILLGDLVQDIHTGFIGVALAKTEFFNGCIQFDVAPKVEKDNKQLEAFGIDIQSLKRIKKGSMHPKKLVQKGTRTGGATVAGHSMRGY